MADETTTARINVIVQGEAEARRLAAAFAQLRGGAAPEQRAAATAVDRGAPEAARRTAGLVEQFGQQFGPGIEGTLRAPFNAMRTGANMATESLLSFAGPLARLGFTATV